MLVAEMASEERVLVDRLVEVGKKLARPPSDVEELLTLLDQAESFLAKVEQSPEQSILTALHPITQALVAKELLTHSCTDVKIAVTACISEITRITAPEPPYCDELMKEVFEMIVDALEGLDSDFSGQSYSKRVLILETVAKVRSCLVMLDLECDELILRMFHLFFRVIRENHEERVLKAMESIMTLVLDESEEISYSLAMCLLSSVRKDNKDASVIVKTLGERVIKNCGAILKPFLKEAMQSSGSHITDYYGVVASVCQDNNDKLKSHHSSKYLGKAGKLSGGAASKKLPQRKSASAKTEPHHHVSSASSMKKIMKKEASVSSPIPVETPDAIRPRRGRPPGSRSHPKKEEEDGKNSEAKQLNSAGKRQDSNGENEHPQKHGYKGKKPKKEVNANKDVVGVPNSVFVALDETLTGSAIKVWWPDDKKFYRGVVDSFDISTGKHRILYADGEEEILVLKDERWEFVHDDSPTSEEDDQDLSHSRSVKRRKKAKSNPRSSKRKATLQTAECGGMPEGNKRESTASGRKKSSRGSGKKSSKNESTSNENSRKRGRSIEEKNYDPGTPEVHCKPEGDPSTSGKLKDTQLNIESEFNDGMPGSGSISDCKVPKASSNPGDGKRSVNSKAVDGAQNSGDVPENGNTEINPKDTMEVCQKRTLFGVKDHNHSVL